MKPVQKTIERMAQGDNCSQAILTAFGESRGLGPELARRLGRPWGGGVAHLGRTCGALTGAVMALGLAVDAPDEGAARSTASRATAELYRRFEACHGSVLCRDLLGADMSTEEGAARIREEGLTAKICPSLVRSAAEILDQVLESEDVEAGRRASCS